MSNIPYTEVPKINLSSKILSIDYIERGGYYIPLCRDSYRTQKANLDGMEAFLRNVIRERGGIVLAYSRKICSAQDPSWIDEGVEIAAKYGATCLVESLCRLTRPKEFYDNRRLQIQAKEQDVQRLIDRAHPVRLMSYLPIDTPADEVSRHQDRRGRWAKDTRKKPGEEGYLKQRRSDLEPDVLSLHKRGIGYGTIAKLQGVTKSDVQRWINLSKSSLISV